MELENDARRHVDVFVILMNCCQDIAIARYLLFGTARRSRFFPHDLNQALLAREDAFDPIGCAGAEDCRRLNQRIEHRRHGAQIRFLPTATLMQRGQQGNRSRFQDVARFVMVIK